MGDDNKHNQYALVVPAVKTADGGIIVMSTHPDFAELVKKEKLRDEPAEQDEGIPARVCHLCGRAKHDVKYDYAKKFNQSRINKIFTTTTINTAPYFKKKDYDLVYALCNQCYRKLLTGEKEVSERFQGKIASENVFIIPESLLGDFNYQFLGRIKDHVDLAFSRDDADAWLGQIEKESELMEQSFYTVNFVFYRTDGKSVTILQVIEDVPILRFTRIIRTIAEILEQMRPHLKWMSIGSIYRIIPVKTNKKKEQLDIGRVLTLYQMLLTGGEIAQENLFGYALEALDKGLKQLGKKQPDNYWNMNLSRYVGGKEDFFIKNIIMSYIVLFHICQRFNLLDRNEFMPKEKRGNLMEASFNKKIAGSIERMEQFLDQQGFKKEARALFYLGTLVYRVAVAQYKQEHHTKPVLKKIDFQGMPPRDIHRLYFEAVEKLHQYKYLNLFEEALMNRFHYYAGSMEGKWPLSEHANVFYVMAGYAYMVGSKPIDWNQEEITAFAEMEREDEGNDSQAE
jgi:CRISPR-associated protein Csh1